MRKEKNNYFINVIQENGCLLNIHGKNKNEAAIIIKKLSY